MRVALILLFLAADCSPTTPSGPVVSECAEEDTLYPGCSEGETPDFEPGCYDACEVEGETCADGGVCTTITYDPCICPGSEICCDACGAQTLVCL